MRYTNLLSIPLATLLLVGCGGSDDSSPAEDESAPNVETVEEDNNSVVLEELPAEIVEEPIVEINKLQGIYSIIYGNLTAEVNFDTNTTLYPSLGCETKFTITDETKYEAMLKEEIVKGDCLVNIDGNRIGKFPEENSTKITMGNIILGGNYTFYTSTHVDGFTNIQGEADKFVSSDINYTTTGFEIHASFKSEGKINLFLDYDAENLYQEDTLLAKELTNISKGELFGVDINCTYTDKESGDNTLLCDDMNSEEDNPLEISYPVTKPLWLSWNNIASFQTAPLNINLSQAGIFDEAVYNQKLREEASAKEAEESAAKLARNIESDNNATEKYNAMSPYVVSTLDITLNNFVEENGYLYLASGERGLEIVKLEDNNTMTVVGTKDTTDARKVVIDGNYAYVADGDAGLKIIDITDPTSPKLEGVIDTNGSALDVLVDGDYAYIADGKAEDGKGGLKIIDISDKENPTLKGSYENSSSYKLFKRGDYIYSAKDNYLASIDVSDPESPTKVDSIATSNYNDKIQTISGDHIITSNSIINISDPANMTIDHSFTTFTTFFSYVNDIKIVDDIAYVADRSRGLTLLDMSDLSNITYKGNFGNVGFIWKVVVADGFAYTHGNGTLSKVNIDTKTSPVVPLKGLAGFGNVVDGDYLYTMSFLVDRGAIESYILDISSINNLNITTISTLGIKYGAFNPKKSGDTLFYLYDRGGENHDKKGMVAVDVSDPSDPKNITGLDFDIKPRDIKIAGDYAYVACGTSTHIVDISDPKNMEIVGSISVKEIYAANIEIKDNYIFLASTRNYHEQKEGVVIIDISDKINPIFVKRLITKDVRAMTLDGDYLYLGGYNFFESYDISNIEEIKFLGKANTYRIEERGAKILSYGNYIFYGNSTNTLNIIDVTNKEFPKTVGHFSDAGVPQQLVGEHLFTSEYIFDVSGLK